MERLNTDMDLWPRIRQAIYATNVNRSALEFEWPECHRTKCFGRHGSVDEAFRIIIDRVAESVRTELLCKATSEPPTYDEVAQ